MGSPPIKIMIKKNQKIAVLRDTMRKALRTPFIALVVFAAGSLYARAAAPAPASSDDLPPVPFIIGGDETISPAAAAQSGPLVLPEDKPAAAAQTAVAAPATVSVSVPPPVAASAAAASVAAATPDIPAELDDGQMPDLIAEGANTPDAAGSPKAAFDIAPIGFEENEPDAGVAAQNSVAAPTVAPAVTTPASVAPASAQAPAVSVSASAPVAVPVVAAPTPTPVAANTANTAAAISDPAPAATSSATADDGDLDASFPLLLPDHDATAKTQTSAATPVATAAAETTPAVGTPTPTIPAPAVATTPVAAVQTQAPVAAMEATTHEAPLPATLTSVAQTAPLVSPTRPATSEAMPIVTGNEISPVTVLSPVQQTQTVPEQLNPVCREQREVTLLPPLPRPPTTVGADGMAQVKGLEHTIGSRNDLLPPVELAPAVAVVGEPFPALHVQQIPLADLLMYLKDFTPKRFAYEIPNPLYVSIDLKANSVEEVMQYLMEYYPVSVTADANTIFIRPGVAKPINRPAPNAAFAAAPAPAATPTYISAQQPAQAVYFDGARPPTAPSAYVMTNPGYVRTTLPRNILPPTPAPAPTTRYVGDTVDANWSQVRMKARLYELQQEREKLLEQRGKIEEKEEKARIDE